MNGFLKGKGLHHIYRGWALATGDPANHVSMSQQHLKWTATKDARSQVVMPAGH